VRAGRGGANGRVGRPEAAPEPAASNPAASKDALHLTHARTHTHTHPHTQAWAFLGFAPPPGDERFTRAVEKALSPPSSPSGTFTSASGKRPDMLPEVGVYGACPLLRVVCVECVYLLI
jgi:hypothetical protein